MLPLAWCCLSRSAYRSDVTCSWPLCADTFLTSVAGGVLKASVLSEAVALELGLSVSSKNCFLQQSAPQAAPWQVGGAQSKAAADV